jgi:hypothetical protein
MLVDAETFADKDIARIYIAGRLSEAKRVESALSEKGIDYAVDIEPFVTRVLGIFRNEYDGVAFYVLSSQAACARKALADAKLRAGLVDD